MIRKQFAENGYYHCKGLFEKKEIEAVKNDMNFVFSTYTNIETTDQSVIDLFRNDFEGFHACALTCQTLLSFNKLQCHQNIIDFLKSIGLEFPVMNTRPLLSISSRHTSKKQIYWKVPSHQDWPSVQGSLNGVTCWIPLVDIDVDLGPLEVAPKTHLLGYLEHKQEEAPVLSDHEYDFVPIQMDVGDALFFNFFTVHRSGTNTTEDDIRWSMHFRYNDILEETFVQRKFPLTTNATKNSIAMPGFPNKEKMIQLMDGLK